MAEPLKWRWNQTAPGLVVQSERGPWCVCYYSPGKGWRFWDDSGSAPRPCRYWGTDPATARAYVEGLRRG